MSIKLLKVIRDTEGSVGGEKAKLQEVGKAHLDTSVNISFVTVPSPFSERRFCHSSTSSTTAAVESIRTAYDTGAKAAR